QLEGIELVPVEISELQAFETARNNRLDWMNARANLVDAWRQIEFNGNALQSGLDVFIKGEMKTRGGNPVAFTAEKGRLEMGFKFDTPITRLASSTRRSLAWQSGMIIAKHRSFISELAAATCCLKTM
ncbi:MAG: hypothetical protein NT013_17800, partial [Planctomycetia bacterium]|nr:hypothetical protein [Planctomycetia bacterium]